MKKGFTLIELLIIVAIIGILASAILLNTGNGSSKAKEQAGRSTMRSVLVNMMLCSGANSSNKAYLEGDFICTNNTVTDARWPGLSKSCTSMTAVAGSNIYIGVCGGVTIVCNASIGSCI